MNNQADNIVYSLCDGGFPRFNDFIKPLILEMEVIRLDYINKYMCTSECPCVKVDLELWGEDKFYV